MQPFTFLDPRTVEFYPVVEFGTSGLGDECINSVNVRRILRHKGDALSVTGADVLDFGMERDDGVFVALFVQVHLQAVLFSMVSIVAFFP